MAHPAVRRVRRFQPSPGEALAIDWSNPLTRDLTLALVLADAAYGYTSVGQNFFPYTSGAQANTVQGTGGKAANTSAPIFNAPSAVIANSTSYSLLAVGSCTSNAVTQSALDMDNSQGSYRCFQFRIASGKADFIPFKTDLQTVTGQCTSPVALTTAELSRGFVIGATASATRTAVFQNGVATAGAPSGMVAPVINIPLAVGARVNGSSQGWATGGMSLVAAWARTLSDAEMASLADNPWQIFKPVPRRLYLAWSASAGTMIAANTGAVSIAGVPATVSAPTIIAAATAAVAVAGQSAQIVTPANVAASTAYVSVAGQPATVSAPTNVSCTTAAVAVAGQSASVVAGSNIAANTAAVSVQGRAAQVVTPSVVAASTGAVSVAGQPATIGQPANVACSTGAVSVLGQPANISSGAGISCTTAAVTVAGQPATISTAQTINCATGVVSVQGQHASVSAATNIACSTAPVTVAGLAATITIPTDISARVGVVAVQGQLANVVTPEGIACNTAVVVVQGQSASITGDAQSLIPNPHRTYVARSRVRVYAGQKRVRTL